MKLVQEGQDERKLMAIISEYQELLRQVKSTREIVLMVSLMISPGGKRVEGFSGRH